MLAAVGGCNPNFVNFDLLLSEIPSGAPAVSIMDVERQPLLDKHRSWKLEMKGVV
jgi:hypothetical protein